MITIQTLFAGLILHWFGGECSHARYPVHRTWCRARMGVCRYAVVDNSCLDNCRSNYSVCTRSSEKGLVLQAPPSGMMADSPVKVNNPGDAPAEPSPEEQKKMEAAYNQMKRKMAISEMGKSIKHKIMVLSGKEVLVNQPLQPALLYPSHNRV